MKKSVAEGASRGIVYIIILKALQTGDKYGYEICKEIEDKSNGTYILKQASLYSGLKRLESSNFVSSYWQDSEIGGKRHYYKITEQGLEKLNSSNFSWNNEQLMNNLFVEKQTDTIQSDTEIIHSDTKIDEVTKIEKNNIVKETIPVEKKNPFAYEVSPLQQDMFSFSQNTQENNDKKEQAQKEEKLQEKNTNNSFEKTKTEDFEFIKQSLIKKYVDTDNYSEKNVVIENSIKENKKPIEQTNDAKFLSKDEFVDLEKKLVLNKKVQTPAKEDYSFIGKRPGEKSEIVKTEDTTNTIFEDKTIEEKKPSNISEINYNEIFEEILLEEEKETNSFEQQSQNENDLPRINILDNINVNLNYNKSAPISPRIKSSFDSIESVSLPEKQTSEINEELSKLNIKKNYQITEQIITENMDLDGIKLKVHTKSNSTKVLSDYISINKFNLMLALIFSFVMLVETILCYLLLKPIQSLSVFDKTYYIGAIVIVLAILTYSIIASIFNNKRSLKPTKFTKELIFCSIIFIMTLAMLYALSLLLGMRSFTNKEFIVQIVLPPVLLSNVIFLPIVKYLVLNQKSLYK